MTPIETRASISGTRRFRLHCERIGETFQIDVALPSRAPADGRPLQVVYVMDANSVFGIAAQTMRFLQDGDGAAPALLVGVGYCLDGETRPRSAYGALRTRDLTPSLDADFVARIAAAGSGVSLEPPIRPAGGADAFLDFLINDLRAFVQERYDVDPDGQSLVGSSLGGLFSLYALLSRPGAFAAHVANSPALWWRGREIFKLEPEVEILPATLFLSVGGLETEGPWRMVQDFERLVQQLRAHAHPGLRLTAHLFEGESHTSVIPAALSRGLATILSR